MGPRSAIQPPACWLSKLAPLVALALASLFCGVTNGQERPDNVESVGGRWWVTSDSQPVYFYQEGGRYYDLFSYHMKDSNGDGIAQISVSHDEQFIIIKSQGYPNHPTAIFPNSDNPNSIQIQDFTFRLPLVPKLADSITRVPMGPIGTALNGVVFFNPFEMEGMNAVEGYSEVWLDACCGHPQQTGVYHYHKYPSCVKSPFQDDGKSHSPIIGFAFDGFPLYGPCEREGAMAKDLKGTEALDVCNGHQDSERGYHYHVTPGRFPYIIGGYAGVVETSNNRGLRRGQTGALEDNTQAGDGRLARVIISLLPGTASAGKKHAMQIELDPTAIRRQPLPSGIPSWVQVGPYEASSISRDGNRIQFEIDIPKDATLGVLLDCHVEFSEDNSRRGPMVFKRNDAFRVVE